MKGAVLAGTKRIEVQEVDEPAYGEDEVLIDVKACGICGSDLHAYRGFHPFRRPPVVLGHEVAGQVVSVGSAVKDVQVGDRVAVEPQIYCGTCNFCVGGLPNFCVAMRRPGLRWGGTLAERMMAPEKVLYMLVPGVSYEEGAVVEPLAVAYRGFRTGQITMGQRVAVLGVGPIGTLVSMLCTAAQVSTLMVTDIKDYNLNFVRSLGVQHAINAAQPVVEEGRALTDGDGFDVVVVTSGAQDSLLQAVELCRPQGVVVVIAIYPEPVLLDPTRVVYREAQIRGSFTYTRRDFLEATRLVNEGIVDVKPLITHRVGLTDAPRMFQEMDAGLDHMKVMFCLDHE